MAPGPCAGDRVNIVPGLDDEPVADTHNEDAWHSECLPRLLDPSLIGELGDNHLRVGGFMNRYVDRLAVQRPGYRRRRGKVLMKFAAATQRRRVERMERMCDVGLFGI